MATASELHWKGMKFPSQYKLEGRTMKKTGKSLMKGSDPLGLKAFKAGVSGKKLKKIM
jgi:hypothetical protein